MTMTLTEAREALADALSEIDGLTVRARGTARAPRSGDGWVTVGRMEPSDFRRSVVTLTAVIVLGIDNSSSEELLETYAVDVIDTVTVIDDFPVANVFLEPTLLQVDQTGTLNAFTITLTTEVEP